MKKSMWTKAKKKKKKERKNHFDISENNAVILAIENFKTVQVLCQDFAKYFGSKVMKRNRDHFFQRPVITIDPSWFYMLFRKPFIQISTLPFIFLDKP